MRHWNSKKRPPASTFFSSKTPHTVFAENKRPPRNKRPPKTVIFQGGGEYTKPMGLDGWFFPGGSTQNRWVLEMFLLLLKIKRPGRLLQKIRYFDFNRCFSRFQTFYGCEKTGKNNKWEKSVLVKFKTWRERHDVEHFDAL